MSVCLNVVWCKLLCVGCVQVTIYARTNKDTRKNKIDGGQGFSVNASLCFQSTSCHKNEDVIAPNEAHTEQYSAKKRSQYR